MNATHATLLDAAASIEDHAEAARRSGACTELDCENHADDLALAHKLRRMAKAIPADRLEMEKQARAELGAALQCLNAGMYAKAEYHAQGGMAICNSLALLKRADALRKAVV